jgi:hypothetical protein
MPENPQPWDEKLLDFVKKTGEDLKRTGVELLGEAQRTLDELRAPEAQDKLKARVAELRTWAKSKFIDVRGRAEEALGVERAKAKTPRSRSTPRKAKKPTGRGKPAPSRGKKPLGRRKR